MQSRPFFIAIVSTLLFATLGQAAEASKKTTHMVPMSDGTPLATDVYLPEGDGPWPVILIRTPYNKNGIAPLAKSAAIPRGYAVVAQDLRGRFESPGSDAAIFHNEGWGPHQDGKDTFTWLVKQPWCDGRIGTWGGSALGITQNMQAPVAPPELKAQYVSVAASNIYAQGMYQGGTFRKSLVEGWLKAAGFDPENLEQFVAHPNYDDFWKEANAEPMASKVDAPAIYHGGWYDIFTQGTINSFVSVQKNGGLHAKGNCRLILGPWAHGPFDGLKYPENSKASKADDSFRYFDHFVRGMDNGVDRDKPVHYYVMGDPEMPDAPGNFWREAESWPPPAKQINYYFHDDGTLNRDIPQGTALRSYDFDPDNPVPTIGGQNLCLPKGPMDQRPVEGRDDVLLFSTDKLKEPVEVTGRIFAKLYVSTDSPDTDFTAKLTDVYPDGRSMLVTDGILRCRFRETFEHPTPMEPGHTYEITVDLWSTSLIFAPGHRIRVAVSSSNFPRFDANPNTGETSHAAKTKRVAHNTLMLSKEHPSHIILPIYQDETK